MQQQYKKLDSISHIHKRPDMYIGTNKTRSIPNEIICNKGENGYTMTVKENTKVNDGFVRIYLEALSNAVDNFYRSIGTSSPMTKIMIELDKETGRTTIYNDGNHIPIEIHDEENIYIPELIFGHLLSGSNYDDTQERQTSGRNGLGIKLLNVFSSEFELECCDPTKNLVYRQKWTDHMKNCSKPKISSKKKEKGYTKISWIPDFSLFGMERYNNTHIALYRKYTMDAAMVTKIPIYWNGEKIVFKKFSSYVNMYLSESSVSFCDGIITNEDNPKDTFSMEYVICESFLPFPCVSFVNGICTSEGGIHCDKFTGELYKLLCKRLSRLKISPKDLKQYFTIFLNVSVINPEFSSQSKTKMVSCASNIQCSFPPRIVNNIVKWNFVNEITNLNKMKDMMNLKKNEKKRGFKRIEGLDPANYAGTKKGRDCVLILCEGLSAKTYSTLGITKGFDTKKGRNYFGIYPLRGKCLNVRNASLNAISNNKEISDIIQALNLKFDVDYKDEKNFNTLYYGSICIITDADEDGHHICALLLNFFHKMFPSLFEREKPFLSIMMTPIAKIIQSNQIRTFYNDYDYQNALETLKDTNRKNFTVKYYKGLGTSSDKEILESFGEKIVNFQKTSDTNTMMDRIFHKNFSSERKEWLLSYNPTSYIVPDKVYPIPQYFNQELIKYSLEDCKRSIPNLFDGLKVSQRKILFSVFKKNLAYQSKSMKVAQLAGYCAEQSNYHHGEQCLYETIIKMCHHFPGSNNIPYFERDGQFGSRAYGGKDAANARYIFTKLAPLTRLIFPAEDDILLDYTLDDGDMVQPDYYIPIIPTSLLNGCTAGIGTGWSCFIPCFNFYEILDKIRQFLNDNQDSFQLKPSYYKYEGDIEKIDDNKYRTVGKIDSFTEKNKLYYQITELPIGTWTDKYKEELEIMQENKKIKNFKNYSTTDKIHFVFEPNSEVINIDSMKLSSLLHLSNMVLFTENDKIQKFKDISEIFSTYFQKRLELYEKRIHYQIKDLQQQLIILNNKSRFILEIVNKTIDIFQLQDENLIQLLEHANYYKKSGTFDYLLQIPIKDLTQTKYNQLMQKIKEIEEQIKKLKKTTAKSIWLKDLDKLEKEYHKFYNV